MSCSRAPVTATSRSIPGNVAEMADTASATVSECSSSPWRSAQGWQRSKGRRSPAGSASRSHTSDRRTSSSVRSSPVAKACSPADALVAEFKQLRDRVPPEPFDLVRTVVEEESDSRYAVFERFDGIPIAAASIAQVHGRAAAHRRRGGRQEVQRPPIAERGARISKRCRGSRPASPAASRSPRSRTRRHSSSCSPRRSSKSSTSGSKPRTCSTSRACSPIPGRRR